MAVSTSQMLRSLIVAVAASVSLPVIESWPMQAIKAQQAALAMKSVSGNQRPANVPTANSGSCESFVELESSDFLKLAYSTNGTILELGAAQTFLVSRCLGQNDPCQNKEPSAPLSSWLPPILESHCETRMSKRLVLAKQFEVVDDDFAFWEILLPAGCFCAL